MHSIQEMRKNESFMVDKPQDIQEQLDDIDRRDNQLQIKRESSMIEELSQFEMNELQLQEELEYDLKKLFREAKKKNGDPKSKRIVEELEEHLRKELEIAINEYEI